MKFKVKVLRIAYGEVEVEVDAEDEAAACPVAVEKAKDMVISSQRSDYEVTGVYSVEEKEDQVPCEECGELTERRSEFTVCERCERTLD